MQFRKSIASILLISASLFTKDTYEMPCLLGLTGLAIGSKLIGSHISKSLSSNWGAGSGSYYNTNYNYGNSYGGSGSYYNTNYNYGNSYGGSVNTNIDINTNLDSNIIADANGNIYGKINGCIITDLLGKTVAKINKSAKTILDLKGKVIGTIMTDINGNITGIAENSDFWKLDWNTEGQTNVNSIIKINNNIITDINGNIYGDITGTKVCNCLGKQIAKINKTKKCLLDLNGKKLGSIKLDSGKNVISITGNNNFWNMDWNNKLNLNTNIKIDGNVIADVNGNFYGKISGNYVYDILGNVIAKIYKTKKVILDLKGNIIANLVYNTSGMIIEIIGNTNFWKLNWNNNSGINTNISVNDNTISDINGNVFGSFNHKCKCIKDPYGKKIALVNIGKKILKDIHGNIIGTIVVDGDGGISNIISNSGFWNIDWNINGNVDCSLSKNKNLPVCQTSVTNGDEEEQYSEDEYLEGDEEEEANEVEDYGDENDENEDSMDEE